VAKSFRINAAFRDLPKNRGARASPEEILQMNCREQIRDHLLIERMRHWLSRARYSSTYNCRKSRARKNFWALVRKYPALAERHGLRERDVF